MRAPIVGATAGIDARRTLRRRGAPPWRYVQDRNRLAGDACLGGYQEFGERACVRPNHGGDIGFATSAAVMPAAALVDLQPGESGSGPTCCPYRATTP